MPKIQNQHVQKVVLSTRTNVSDQELKVDKYLGFIIHEEGSRIKIIAIVSQKVVAVAKPRKTRKVL